MLTTSGSEKKTKKKKIKRIRKTKTEDLHLHAGLIKRIRKAKTEGLHLHTDLIIMSQGKGVCVCGGGVKFWPV